MKKSTKQILIPCFVLLLASTTVFFLHQQFDYFGWQPLSFVTYPDLSSKQISHSDYETILDLHNECFEETKRQKLFAYLSQSKYPNSDQGLLKLLKQRVNDYVDSSRLEKVEEFHATENVTIARKNKQPIGLYNCHEDFSLTNGSIMIFNVCLSSKKRGQGIGKEIMLHAIERCAAKGKDLTLTVYKDNTPALKLYEKLNFKIIEASKEPEDEFSFFDKHLMKYFGPTK